MATSLGTSMGHIAWIRDFNAKCGYITYDIHVISWKKVLRGEKLLHESNELELS